MLNLVYTLILIFSFGFLQNIKSMVYDNRYAPEYMSPILFKSNPRLNSNLQIIPLYMRANHAFNEIDGIGLPEINGKFNLAEIDKALRITNQINQSLLKSDFIGLPKITWDQNGRLDIEALALYYQNILCDNVIFGTSYLFGYVNSRFDSVLNKSNNTSIINVTDGDEEYLYSIKDTALKKLHIGYPIYRKVLSGDWDIFFKFGKHWSYKYRCRSIDAWTTLGTIVPVGQPYDIHNPASIVLGGNKHWGIYFGTQGHLEIREDLHIDILLRAIKRLPKTFQCARMPACQEPENYGAIIGPLYVNPGFTLVFSGFLILEDFSYDGLGAKLGYTVIGHLEDTFKDKRKDQSVKSNLTYVKELSSWGIEFVRACAFYDFTKKLDCLSSRPIISLYLDVPVHSTISKRSFKTYALGISIETNF